MGPLTVWLRRWAPPLACGLLSIGAMVAALHVGVEPVVVPALPAQVVVATPRAAEGATGARPLFASATPAIAADPAGEATAAAPPPTLTGVATGNGRSVALLRLQSGTTAMLHVGEAADGWTIVAIDKRTVQVDRAGLHQALELGAKPTVSSASGSGP